MTEQYENPIKAKSRGKILVAAMVVGGATGTVTGALAMAGVAAGWIAVVASGCGAFGAIATSLARANLSPDDIRPQAPRSDE